MGYVNNINALTMKVNASSNKVTIMQEIDFSS